MKKKNYPLGLVLLLACAMLFGCKANVDLNNIDPSAKLEMGLALPIGEINLKLGNFLKDTTIKELSINEDGVYQFDVDMSIKENRTLEDINMSQYTGVRVVDFPLSLPSFPAGYQLPAAMPFTVDTVFRLAFDGLNANPLTQRIDSIILTGAHLSVNISNQNIAEQMIQLKNIVLTLPEDGLRRMEGSQNVSLTTQFNQTDEHPLGTCHLIMMNNPSATPSASNLKDSLEFNLHIEFEIPANVPLTVGASPALRFNINTHVEGFNAIYGFFNMDDMSTSYDTTLNISEMLPALESIKRFSLPLAKPSFSMRIGTNIGVPLKAGITSMEVSNGSEKREFLVDGKKPEVMTFENYVKVTDPMEEMAYNTLSYSYQNSNLGDLLTIRPEQLKVGIGFGVDAARENVPQHRVADVLAIDGSANLTIPFEFKEGAAFEYSDTIEMDLSQLTLDSLLGEVDVFDSVSVRQLSLVVVASNWLPYTLKASFRYLDENYQDVRLNEDGLTIPGPTDYNEQGKIVTPGTNNITITLNNERMDKLTRVKHIIYDVTLEDADLENMKNKNVVFPVKLTPENQLSVKIALAADVAAYLKLAFNENNK